MIERIKSRIKEIKDAKATQVTLPTLWIPILCIFVGVLIGGIGERTTQNQSIQSEQKVVLQKTTYDQLKQNNEKALNIIKASNLTLTEAQKSIVEQQTQLDRLKQDNSLQAKELAIAKQNSIEQQASLKKIEDSLNKSIEQVKKDKKKMQSLKTQRNLWAVLAIVASGFAIAK